MDENQQKYKTLFDYTDYDVRYRNFIVKLDMGTHVKKLIVRACCKNEIVSNTSHKILSILEEK